MNKEKIISFILNKPKKSLLLSLTIFLLTMPGLFFLRPDFSYRTWYGEEDPLLQSYDRYEKEFGNDDNIIIALKNPSGIFNKKTLHLIHKLTTDLQNFEETAFVDSLSTFVYIEGNKESISLKELYRPKDLKTYDLKDFEDIKKKAQTHFFSKERLVAASSEMAIIEGIMGPTEGKNVDYGPFVLKLRSLLKKYQKNYPDHEFHILGNAQVAFLFKEIVEKDVAVLFPLLFLLFTLILYFILKRKSYIALIYLNIGFSITSMMGLMGFLGFKITSITSIAPQMLLTVALADLIHLMSNFSIKDTGNISKALENSLKKNFSPTLLTTLTTAGGLLSFTFSKVATISELGIIISLGVLMAWFYSFFFFSPLLLFFEKRFFRETRKKDPSPPFDLFSFIKNYHSHLLFGTALTTLFAVYLCSKLSIDMNPIHQFKKNNHFRKSHAEVKKHFGSSSTLEIVFSSPKNQKSTDPKFLKKIEEFEKWALKQSYVVKSFSLLNILKTLNKSFNEDKESFFKVPSSKKAISSLLLFYRMGLPSEHNRNRFINFDDNILRMTLITKLESSKEGLKAISALNKKIKELQIQGQVTGKIPLFHELTPYVFKTFWKSFLLALAIISLILMVTLKSITLGLLALIPNLFPILIGGSLYYLFGIQLDMGSALIASFCLGISVDDTIHFLFDYKKNAGTKQLKENFQDIMGHTFPPLFYTSMVLMAGFASFATANYIPNIKFGLMVAVILVIALFADFIILPSLLFFKNKHDHKINI